MAVVVTMPRLSDTMTEGVVATWLKKVGDVVKEGDILAEIETDKATMEFESFNSGTLLHIGIQEGESAPVDALLAIIGNPGEDISALLSGGGQPAAAAPKEETAPASEDVKTETKSQAAEIPAGVKIVTMPRLSDTMTDGTVATWLKKIGDSISEGDILAEIETDKATMEFESFNSGTLLYIGVQEGQSAPVDSILAIIGPAGTDVSALAANYKAGGAVETVAETKTEVKETTATTAAPQTTTANGRVLASPLAKKIAQEKGVDLTQVKGTGENGRIVKKDVESFTSQAASAQPQTA
ncbi:MAG: biotin/lipoyl-binding protein, partial [Flavobacterium sp.]|nr:biotin/lipoyl-binding protein [Flavobacterium sp.]